MNARTRQLVIFDLDGTLLDTLGDLADSMNEVLSSRGFPIHPVDAYRYFVGDGVANLVRRAVPEGNTDPSLIEDCVGDMKRIYGERWSATTSPYAGIKEMLESLSGHGVRAAILSNKPHEMTRRMVDHYFPATPFVAVLGAREGIPRKPDPAGVLEILQTAGVSSAQALFVGDTATDVDTARAAGLDMVGVLWGFRPRSELEGRGANWVVGEAAEIVNLACPPG